MSGLQARAEDQINGVDVREQGSALRVATNTPHLVSLGTGRLSTAVTLHPIKQGRVTIGSDPTCDIYVVGTGVASVHCHVENSHNVVTLYPLSGSTLLDGLPVERPTRLSQGSMLTIGRSNYLRFNHPQEAMLMKSVLPSSRVSMAPVQYQPNEQCQRPGFQNHNTDTNQQCYQAINVKVYKDNSLTQLDQELDMTLKEMSRKKPPVVPRKPYRDLELSDSNSDQESRPKVSSIMAKVSKFEYYAKQQKNIGRSQFYTSNENEISPKVFSSNSLTVNTPAKDVLGGKNMPNYMNKLKQDQKVIHLTENNISDTKSGSYQNVAIRNKTKIDDIVRNFDENSRLPKKINNDQHTIENTNLYGKINTDIKNNFECTNQSRNVAKESTTERNEDKNNFYASKNSVVVTNDLYGKIPERNANVRNVSLPSPCFDRNPQYSPVYANCSYDRSLDAESRRFKAYQDRIKEEEQKQAETARLEEILNMCAEYERQIASGIPITPTEKRPHNKIITNGSLPRSVALNNPNFVQTSEGYYKFETSQHRNNSLSQSLPIQRNLSSYENFDPQSPHDQRTPEVTIPNQNFENSGRMDEIGIPVFDNSPKHELSSPIMIRKLQNGGHNLSTSPIGSPYENVYYNRSNALLKPKSPNTNSPRTRIKTTFAHKNLPSPQYFVFPTPPPKDNSQLPNFNQKSNNTGNFNQSSPKDKEQFNQKERNVYQSSNKIKEHFNQKESNESNFNQTSSKDKEQSPNEIAKRTDKVGIEKQLSLEEEIPMIDDADSPNEVEFRISKTVTEKDKNDDVKDKVQSPKYIVVETQRFIEKGIEQKEIETTVEKLTKNKSFDDVKKELMADIPELEEFEKDLKENKREKIIKGITEDMRKMDIEADSIDSVLDDTAEELKTKYDRMKDERKKLVAEIHEIKCKMSEIRLQEDDILRELEMEKALIKGEYDSEIAILNIEQKKKIDLLEKAKKIEEEIRRMKERQEARQNEMRDRVEIATLKVERIEKDLKENTATIEELQFAQDILDHETKIFEDLEFQHLEEESELLANREDLQNEIIILTKKIEAQKSRILTLKSEANDNLTSALDETKVLQAEYVRLLNQVEEITSQVQTIEKELKPIVNKLNDIERTQSPDSAFYTDQTRAKSGEFGYSPQSSDSDDFDITKISEHHTNKLKDKFNSIDQMSQSMIVDIERRVITDVIDDTVDENNKSSSESPSKSSTSSKEKKGFWERNFDSLKRKKKQKSPEKIDIMSQSLNENMFYNNENIENDNPFDKFNSLRHSKNKKDKQNGPVKSNSSSKIPTFAALGKIIKKDSMKKKNENNKADNENEKDNTKNRYVKHVKTVNTDNKYIKAKSLSPEKTKDETIKEEQEDLEEPSKNTFTPVNQQINIKYQTLGRQTSKEQNDLPKILHRKSCGDEPSIKTNVAELQKISDSGKIPSQDDIDRISKVTMDAPILSSDTDMNSLGKRTLDSLMEIERKRMEMLEEQGCQMIENEREKISELKRRVQDETKKLWDQKYREQTKSLESECHSLPSNFESRPIDSGVKDGGDMTEREDSLMDDSFNMTNSMLLEESSGLMSSIEEDKVKPSSSTAMCSEESKTLVTPSISSGSSISHDCIPTKTPAVSEDDYKVAPGGSQEPDRRQAVSPDRNPEQESHIVEVSDDEVGARKHKKVSRIASSEDDESSAPKKYRTNKAHAEDACKIRMASLQVTIAKLNQSKDRGLLTEGGKAELRSAKNSLKVETKSLRKLEVNKEAARKYRKKKREAIQDLIAKNPEAGSIVPLHANPGRPRLENEDDIIKTITEIAMFGSSADERRRSEIIRTCRTLDDLHRKLTDMGFEISRSATYIRLIPRRSVSLEGKRHVKTAPVRLIRAQEDSHKSHPDTDFCVASIRKLECLASLLGEDSGFISQDDKARVPIGLAAANKQAPFLMHMDYLVRLPDHSFVIGPGHKLIPSVYAGCQINATKPIGQPDGVSYTGPTYVAIRSGKHSSSTAATHAQDLERLLNLDNFKNILKTPTDEVKPVLIFTVDGGPDENPRYKKVIAHAVRHFQNHNLDYIAIACNAPGRSAFNRVERRMAPLSHQLAGLILPHDKFGSHLDTQRRTTDIDLEKKNFQFAGEALAEVWSEMVIDGESIVAEYISPDEPIPDSDSHPNPEWYVQHVKESQYILQISKCSDLVCCSKPRSKLRKILPDGFLPPPIRLTTNLDASTPLSEDASFCPLYLQLALKVEVPLGNFKKLPYDYYCPTLQEELMQRCCSQCGNYFASQTSMKEHKKSHGRQDQLQVRNSRTDSTEEDKRSDDSRPLSHASDFSRDNILSLGQGSRRSRRAVAPCSDAQRPLTRYLPVDRDDFDLRAHIDSAGHQVELCPYVTINSASCRGYLHKLGAKFHTWSKRWFVFDRESKTFVYYWDKSEKKPRGGAYFQVIEEVYLDHGNTSKSPSPQTTFIVKTRQRRYYLMAPSGEAARIWIDVIFTGAQGYTEYLE